MRAMRPARAKATLPAHTVAMEPNFLRPSDDDMAHNSEPGGDDASATEPDAAPQAGDSPPSFGCPLVDPAGSIGNALDPGADGTTCPPRANHS